MFIFIYLVFFVHKICLLRDKSFLSKKIKWSFYFPSLFSEVASLLGIYIILVEYIGISFSNFISFCFFCLAIIIENIIFLIVGIILFIREKKKRIRKKKVDVKTVILSFIGISLLLNLVTMIPVFWKTDIEKYIEEEIIEYLESKYGDGDFKIKTLSKEYSGGLFGESEEFVGYISYVKSSYLKDDYIYVTVDGISKETIVISYDSFISDYYDKDTDTMYYFEYIKNIKESRVKSEYKDRFNISIDGYYDSYEVPLGFGRIPNEEELIDLTEIIETSIEFDLSNNHILVEDKIGYLFEITDYSVEYLKLDSDFEIDVRWDRNKGSIKCENDIVSISLGDEVKTYSISEFK